MHLTLRRRSARYTIGSRNFLSSSFPSTPTLLPTTPASSARIHTSLRNVGRLHTTHFRLPKHWGLTALRSRPAPTPLGTINPPAHVQAPYTRTPCSTESRMAPCILPPGGNNDAPLERERGAHTTCNGCCHSPFLELYRELIIPCRTTPTPKEHRIWPIYTSRHIYRYRLFR